MPKRRAVNQALTARCPSGGLDHVGFERRLINESKLFQMVAHERLTACDPEASRQCHVRRLYLAAGCLFLTAEPKPVADRGTGNFQPMIRAQFLAPDRPASDRLWRPAGAYPAIKSAKLAPAAIALRLWFERTVARFSRTMSLTKSTDSSEMCCCRMVCSVFNKCNNLLAKLYRVRFAHM